MRPGLLRNRKRFIRSGIGPASGASPAEASQSASVVRYPGGYDTAPTMVDDESPLVAQWYNFLGLMCEAIMAECGPLGAKAENVVGQSTSLQRFLGVEGASRLSLYKSVTKSEAGQVLGLMKKYVSGTGTFANNEQTTTITNHHGADPGNRYPAVFANTNQLPGTTVADMVAGPVVMRANSPTPSSGDITIRYRACAAAGGAPAGSATFSADILAIFMPFT